MWTLPCCKSDQQPVLLLQTAVGTVGHPLPCLDFCLAAVPEMDYDPMIFPPRGEVLIRGPVLFSGYYKDDVATAQVPEQQHCSARYAWAMANVSCDGLTVSWSMSCVLLLLSKCSVLLGSKADFPRSESAIVVRVQGIQLTSVSVLVGDG